MKCSSASFKMLCIVFLFGNLVFCSHDEEDDSALDFMAQDGAVITKIDVSVCEPDLTEGGYGICGSVFFYPRSTQRGVFFGFIYENEDDIVMVDEDIYFTLTALDFALDPDSPPDDPCYTFFLTMEGEEWPISAEVEGLLIPDEVTWPDVYVRGTMNLDAFGEHFVFDMPGRADDDPGKTRVTFETDDE